MKYCSALLFILLLLGGCSGGDTVSSDNLPSESITETTSPDNASDVSGEGVTKEEDTDTSADSSEESSEKDAEEADKPEDAEEEKEDTDGIDQKNVKLVVRDQETAGQIIVKEVATSRDGWVSIHKSNADGGIVLPKSIGQARVNSGDNEDVVVDLWDAPYVGEKLWVLLHIDSGERGKYEFPEKDPAVRKNGETMARSFKVNGEEEEQDKDEE